MNTISSTLERLPAGRLQRSILVRHLFGGAPVRQAVLNKHFSRRVS